MPARARGRRTRAALLAQAALAALALLPGSAGAQRVDIASGINSSGEVAAAPILSGEEILQRALDNLFAFDTSLSVKTDKKRSDGTVVSGEFLVLRKRAQDARRVLVVSVKPQSVQGTRVLQINYDDGREETFAFVQSIGGEPVRARYRLAEPFLCTWHEIENEETPVELLALREYEVLGLEPREMEGEAVYKLTVRPLSGRGYDWAELFVARADYAILEYRHYFSRNQPAALVAVAPRASMVKIDGHVLPERMRYRDLFENAEIDVRLRHTPLAPDQGDELFLPQTFHRVPIGALRDLPPPPAPTPQPGG